MASGTKRRSTNELALFPVQFPSGTVVPFAGSTAPEGWALCDGSTVSRSTYSALFAAIGEAWGNGDGSTTFHLPDMRGRFLRGVDAAAGNDPDAGSRTAANTGGNSGDTVGSVQDDAFQNHGHRVYSDPGNGGPYFNTSNGYDNTLNGGGSSNARALNIISNGGGTPKLSTENRPKNANVNYIIKL